MSRVPPKTPTPVSPLLAGKHGRGVRLRICTRLAEVNPAQWDRLLDIDDAPLLSWGYLQGLEEAGCVGEAAGWLPTHLLLYGGKGSEASQDHEPEGPEEEDGEEGELLAAAPAYVKTNSDGEWVYDLDWAAFAQHHRLAYYPKLVLAVPFNPVTGGRLLTRRDLPSAERAALREALLRGAQRFCQQARLSSAHVLFPRGPRPGAPDSPPDEAALPPETAAMAATGFLLRRQEQYHFLNEGYRTFDDYLAGLRSHRRSAIRRERRELAAAGITVRTHRGLQGHGQGHGMVSGGSVDPSFTREELDRVFDMYVATSHRYTGGPPFLNRRCFHLCAERLGDRLELVLARDRQGSVIGGAWNLRGDRRLYGRYWGRIDTDASPDSNTSADSDPDLDHQGPSVPFLHFEVCYYHAIERCIQSGLAAFEPGHGGDQKLVRGFTPSYTYSAHYLRDARLRLPIEAFLKHEAPLVQESLLASTKRCNVRKKTGL